MQSNIKQSFKRKNKRMYIPHTWQEREVMLHDIGVANIEELFKDIPLEHRFPQISLPPALSEMEVASELQSISYSNESVKEFTSFLGAGAYHHYIPAAVDSLLRRGEFYTAYTPYQPEISQGTLRAIFDYQSLVAALTGMEVSNASHYDGATAVAEAVSLAYANFRGKRTKVILSPSLNPQYRETVHTYNHGSGIKITGENLNPASDPNQLIPIVDLDTCLVVVQYPDFFGRIYDLQKIADETHKMGALFAVSVNPTALGLFTPPGSFGADIVTGEGQPLGIPLSFGGPYLGIFATRQELVRKMAGRLVGETVDNRGQRAYVLTLTAREQHIRREKATSNICTNQALMALAATIYLSLLGKNGLQQVANLCYQKAHYAAEKITSLPGYQPWDEAPFFHEFAVKAPLPIEVINNRLLEYDILGGLDLGKMYPTLTNHWLLAVTEMNSKEDIDQFVDVLAEISHE
jgi:glycine dehydrogenase subunit 1